MARVVDDRGRLFGKVNVLDLLVLLAIVGLAVFVGLRVDQPVEEVRVEITLLVEAYDQKQVEAFTTLGTLRDEGGKAIGTIEKAEIYDRVPFTLEGEGWEVTLEEANRPAVLIYVSAVAHARPDGFHVGSLNARVGAIKDVVGPGWEGEAQVVHVEQVPAAAE